MLYAEDARSYQHPSRKLQFLMGRRGKNELMPIGGAWEPCDGAHPELDASVLIKTAARSFREATGLNLSLCAKWYVCSDRDTLVAIQLPSRHTSSRCACQEAVWSWNRFQQNLIILISPPQWHKSL